MIEAGKLNRRITFQQLISTVDAESIVVNTWTDTLTKWAAVEPLRGREYFQAAAVGAENTVRFRIRYQIGDFTLDAGFALDSDILLNSQNFDFTAVLRIRYGTRIFNIRSVIDPEERHRELHLMCEEVVNGS